MKFLDEKGRIFNKINILDLLFIILIVFLLFLAMLKISGEDLEDFGTTSELVDVEFTLSVPMSAGYLDVIKKGDQLAEVKQFLNAYVEDVEIQQVLVNNLDENGNIVESVDPTMEVAHVLVSGTVKSEDMSYKLGGQELRQGKIIFLESQFYKMKGQIESIKVVN